MYSCGFGSSGELGLNEREMECWLPKRVIDTDMKPVMAIAAGANHSAAITADGFLLSWGCGRHGKLCQGEENFASQFTPAIVRRLRHIRVVLVGCGGCHTMVLGCHRHEGEDDARENTKQESHNVKLPSPSNQNRKRLVDGVLPPLKSSGLPPLKHTVMPTVPDTEDVGHPSVEANVPPDITDAAVNKETRMEVECNGERPAIRFLSDTESEAESIVPDQQESLNASPSPGKKSGRLARFFSRLRNRKSSPIAAVDSTNGGSLDGSVGTAKEAFVHSADTSIFPSSAESTERRQSKACSIL